MREDLIKKLDDNYTAFKALFLPGLGNSLRRLALHPFKIFVRMVQIRVLKGKSFLVHTKTFFGYPMTIHSFESCLWFAGCLNYPEVALQKYIIKNLQANHIFFDIGAHHGFYSLLAHRLIVGERGTGEIHAFEPTDTHYAILKENTESLTQIHTNRNAVCSTSGDRIFYETVGAGSTIERNFFKNIKSINLDDFRDIKVSCVTLDSYCTEHNTRPSMIKIDVEGSEYEVLNGGRATLGECAPIIAMEAWSKPYDNTNHIKAINLLKEIGYSAFRISDSGDAVPMKYEELLNLLEVAGNSNNFIFKK